MTVKIVYDNKKDRELVESVEFSTPFFVEYIDALTKNGLKESSSNNTKKANKLMNKEINIVVHNDKNISNNDNICNNISLSKLKNKFFYMRIKLIKNALKMIKDAL